MDKLERAATPRTATYKQFHLLAKSLAAVPKSELDKLLAKEKKTKARKAKRRKQS